MNFLKSLQKISLSFINFDQLILGIQPSLTVADIHWYPLGKTNFPFANKHPLQTAYWLRVVSHAHVSFSLLEPCLAKTYAGLVYLPQSLWVNIVPFEYLSLLAFSIFMYPCLHRSMILVRRGLWRHLI